MSDIASQHDIDIRGLPEAQGHRVVLDAYEQLEVDATLIVVSDQDPQALRKVLDRELAGALQWETLRNTNDAVRTQLTKCASTALPREVANTSVLIHDAEAAGSIWQLEPGARDLDANIIALKPDNEITMHIGPELDVLIVVLRGAGVLHTELDEIPLQRDSIVWLPRKSQRRFIAGSDGLRYFSVHQRKPTLNISMDRPPSV